MGDQGSIPGLGRSSGEEMAIHSSILAWRIPWTEKLGGLQSMGSQRVRHDSVTNTHVSTILLSHSNSEQVGKRIYSKIENENNFTTCKI